MVYQVDVKIELTLRKMAEYIKKRLFSLDDFEYVECDYKHDNSFPTEGWQKLAPQQYFRGKDKHYWLRTSFKTPEAKEDKSYFISATSGYEGKWDATNPQCLIYLNGKMSQACDTNHTEIFVEPDTEYELHNYLYLGLIDQDVKISMNLFELDKKIEQLYYDISVAFDTAKLHHTNSNEYFSIMSVLEKTCNLVDLRMPFSEEFYASVDNALEFIKVELYEKLCSKEGKPIVNCIGHTHIDVEWQWTRAQTREKIQRSFATAAQLMKMYPEYKFMLSQPELYRYLKEEAPEKYEELKQLVKEGRWEPEGAMYVEADCNLSSGESLIRQIMQGKKFFKDEFGVDNTMLFLPDVFGYSAALPQILTKCGIDTFITSKISWNDTNTMPDDVFMWEGLDGTEIFTSFITTQGYKSLNPDRYTTYVGKLTPSEIKGTWNRFANKDYANRSLTTFGWGDGGGGPTKAMLETQRRLAKGLPGMPVTEIGFIRPYIDKLKAEFEENCVRNGKTLKWVGELYLEKHRGTYTSIAKNKRNNRLSEFALSCTEALSFADLYFGGSYDSENIYKKWTKVLHNQFHDIIPGSSIFEVYEGTDKDYAEILGYCNDTISNKLIAFAQNVNADKGYLVYNPLGFARKGSLKLNGKTVEIKDEIPSFGWAVINDINDTTDVTVNGLIAENKYFKMMLDSAGRIESLYDKRADREVFLNGKKANELIVYEDFEGALDAWEIREFYKGKYWVLDDDAEITSVNDGSRAGFKITRSYHNSNLTQYIWLYSDIARVDVENEFDWHEKHQLLKVYFPANVHTNKATYETQFGHLERPTYYNTSWDRAKFEVCGHKWVDVSENGYGVSILNDSKYGFDTNGSTIGMSILKCATFPNIHADQGTHIFNYSIVPHIGDFRTSGVINEAYSFNQPLIVTEVGKEKGSAPSEFSLVSCDKNNIIIKTVKKAENDDAMIIRLYDSFDCRSNAKITVAAGFKKVYICDMLENELEELDIVDNSVTLPVSNFEIVTLKFIR